MRQRAAAPKSQGSAPTPPRGHPLTRGHRGVWLRHRPLKICAKFSDKKVLPMSKPRCRHCNKIFIPAFRAGKDSKRSRDTGRERSLTAAQFCSARCKQANYRWRQKQGVYPTSFSAVTPPLQHTEIIEEISAISADRRARIAAPAHVLDAEVWGGRHWHDSVSRDGVAIQVSRFRQRALWERE